MPLILLALILAALLTLGACLYLSIRKPRIGLPIVLILAALLVTLFSKWEPGYKSRTRKFAETVEHNVDPTELRRWAMQMLEEAKTDPKREHYGTWQLPSEKVPANIRQVPNYEYPLEDAWTIPGSHSEEGSIWLYWGGGFGHWGICVSSPTFKVDEKVDDKYYIEWRPGIYFFAETR